MRLTTLYIIGRGRVLHGSYILSLKHHFPVLVGFYIPMRQEEIFKITWVKVDIGIKYIRLRRETKNKNGRVISLRPKVLAYLNDQPRPIHGGYIFEKYGLIDMHLIMLL